jgi:transcriptional regulator with XRE-family HTH domain
VSDEASSILAANLAALMAASKELTSQGKVGKRAGIDQRTVGRIRNQENPPTLEQVSKLAKAFGLEVWQLFVPGLNPSNPPMLTHESEPLRAMLKNIANTKEAIEGYLREEGNTTPGKL